MLEIAPRPITPAQRSALHKLASATRTRLSFTSPHGVAPSIRITGKNLNVRYPHSQDGYRAAQNLLEQLAPTSGEE